VSFGWDVSHLWYCRHTGPLLCNSPYGTDVILERLSSYETGLLAPHWKSCLTVRGISSIGLACNNFSIDIHIREGNSAMTSGRC
jgi:hypothetical protein